MKYKTILIIFAISLICSVILSFIPTTLTCNTVQNTCNEVQKSDYSQFLGIQNSYYGVVIFAFLTFLTISHIKHPVKYKKQIIHAGIIIGAGIALYLLYIQQFVLGEYCKFCVITDTSLLIAFGIVVFTWKK